MSKASSKAKLCLVKGVEYSQAAWCVKGSRLTQLVVANGFGRRRLTMFLTMFLIIVLTMTMILQKHSQFKFKPLLASLLAGQSRNTRAEE
jgi:hypothetical protein